MKKQITGFFGLIALSINSLYSQSTFSGAGAAGHLGTTAATDWCGWNAMATL